MCYEHVYECGYVNANVDMDVDVDANVIGGDEGSVGASFLVLY